MISFLSTKRGLLDGRTDYQRRLGKPVTASQSVGHDSRQAIDPMFAAFSTAGIFGYGGRISRSNANEVLELNPCKLSISNSIERFEAYPKSDQQLF
jgi:hypothetical protein